MEHPEINTVIIEQDLAHPQWAYQIPDVSRLTCGKHLIRAVQRNNKWRQCLDNEVFA